MGPAQNQCRIVLNNFTLVHTLSHLIKEFHISSQQLKHLYAYFTSLYFKDIYIYIYNIYYLYNHTYTYIEIKVWCILSWFSSNNTNYKYLHDPPGTPKTDPKWQNPQRACSKFLGGMFWGENKPCGVTPSSYRVCKTQQNHKTSTKLQNPESGAISLQPAVDERGPVKETNKILK